MEVLCVFDTTELGQLTDIFVTKIIIRLFSCFCKSKVFKRDFILWLQHLLTAARVLDDPGAVDSCPTGTSPRPERQYVHSLPGQFSSVSSSIRKYVGITA